MGNRGNRGRREKRERGEIWGVGYFIEKN